MRFLIAAVLATVILLSEFGSRDRCPAPISRVRQERKAASERRE